MTVWDFKKGTFVDTKPKPDKIIAEVKKMNINWYPGHMTKARRMIEENIGLIDVAVYVLDSRAPWSCLNPDFESILNNLPVIFVLNKSDLGDKARIDEWLRFFTSPGRTAVAIDSTMSKSAKILTPIMSGLCAEKLARYKNRGIRKAIRAMVLGVPNSGKSTLINNLCGAGKTVTGDRPGVTKGKQWIRINDFLEVLDTPGTLYPKLVDQRVARRLAYIGSIKDEVVDTCELAMSFLDEALSIDRDIVLRRYKIETASDSSEILNQIARARGFILPGNQVDVLRAATAILDDFRKGKLGRITLDSPTETERDQ